MMLQRKGLALQPRHAMLGRKHSQSVHLLAEHRLRGRVNKAAQGQGSTAEQLNQITNELLQMFYSQLSQQQASTTGATLTVQNLTYHPAGAEQPLLNDVSFTLPANQMGLLIGRSGSGKTTLLQVLAGFAQQTSGDIVFSNLQPAAGATSNGTAPPASSAMEERMQKVGLVFQFPERHFLGEDVLQELTFAWPRTYPERQQLSMRLPQVLTAVGMSEVPIELPPSSLSGGQQRRLALATQLVRQPSLLLLDEPLAGLDWKARAEVADMLRRLKGECTVLVVSHDLQELEPLVDCAWRMLPGGKLEPASWPLSKEDAE